MLRALPLVLVAALLAGCQASPALDRLRGESPAPEPVYLERRAEVGPQHEARYEVPVVERAVELNVTLTLEARDAGPGSPASPAKLDVQVLSPSGAVLARGVVDAASPGFAYRTTELPETGVYEVRVVGSGVSQALPGGQGLGASYALVLEVLHA